jgi:hypothetical protein
VDRPSQVRFAPIQVVQVVSAAPGTGHSFSLPGPDAPARYGTILLAADRCFSFSDAHDAGTHLLTSLAPARCRDDQRSPKLAHANQAA